MRNAADCTAKLSGFCRPLHPDKPADCQGNPGIYQHNRRDGGEAGQGLTDKAVNLARMNKAQVSPRLAGRAGRIAHSFADLPGAIPRQRNGSLLRSLRAIPPIDSHVHGRRIRRR